jgi:outer membrane cobalamin receptor
MALISNPTPNFGWGFFSPASCTRLDLDASYVVAQQVRNVRHVRLQMKIENLFNNDYETLGFSSPSISVRRGTALNF